MGVGIGAALDFGGELFGNLFGAGATMETLRRQGNIDRMLETAFRPGEMRGTLNPAAGQWLDTSGARIIEQSPNRDLLRNALWEGAAVDARIPFAVDAMGVFDRNRGILRQGAERLQGDVGTLRQDIRDRRTAGQQAAAGRQQETMDFTNQRVAGIDQAGAEVSDRFRRIADDPTILSQAEIDAMIQRQIEGNIAQAGRDQATLQAGAARRGISGPAAQAAQVLLGDANRRQNEQASRDFMIANAQARAARQDAATEALGRFGAQFGGLAAQTGLTGRDLVQQIAARAGQEELASFGLDADMTRFLQDSLGNIDRELLQENSDEAAALAGLGDMLQEGNLTEMAMRSGNEAAAGALAAGLGSNAFANAAGLRAARQAQRTTAQNQPSDWERFWGTAGGPLGAAAGGLFSNPNLFA